MMVTAEPSAQTQPPRRRARSRGRALERWGWSGEGTVFSVYPEQKAARGKGSAGLLTGGTQRLYDSGFSHCCAKSRQEKPTEESLFGLTVRAGPVAGASHSWSHCGEMAETQMPVLYSASCTFSLSPGPSTGDGSTHTSRASPPASVT